MKELLKIAGIWIASWLLVLAPTLAFAQNPVLGGKAKVGGRAVFGGGSSPGHSFGLSFNGSTAALNSSATVDLTSTGTISIWFWMNKTAFANNDFLAAESSTNHNSNNGSFIIDPNGGLSGACTNFFVFGVHQGGLEEEAGFTRPTSGTWHSYLLVLSTTGGSSDKAYLDGVSASGLTACDANSGSGNFGNYTIYLMSRAAASLWTAGSMAEFTVWKADESANASTLNGGTLPSAVDASNLVRYTHLCGNANPEPDTQAGSWIFTGTPSQITGPGVLNCP
jgi:hypothetical protein